MKILEIEESEYAENRPILQTTKLVIHLIRPSLYDEKGYVIRFQRGVLPSNTLACLSGLTQKLIETQALGEYVDMETRVYDEIVDLVDPEAICEGIEKEKFKGNRIDLFCLCGVQSNQFPRASDLAKAFRSKDYPAMIGGFHVSGIYSVFGKPSQEISDLIALGVTVVLGEVEDTWEQLLRAVIVGRTRPVYNFLHQKPELGGFEYPRIHQDYLHKFALREFATMDLGRGCVFSCSFCTIINVHGKLMRHRSIENLKIHLRENYENLGIYYYFFTDDNFSRNKQWREILGILADLRQEGIPINFMMQVDTQAYKITGFVEASRAAGCTQVFIGMESLNEDNLQHVGKKQNKVDSYKKMIDMWKANQVTTHVGYILGFPYDTYDSLRKDIQKLCYEIAPDMASFFILTPLPGSEDHRELVESKGYMDPDLNRFDSFHVVTRHPRMTEKEWAKVYKYAWSEFYSSKRIMKSLSTWRGVRLREMIKNFVWYKYSIKVNKLHPMVSGFHRKIDRKSLRRGWTKPNRIAFSLRRIGEITIEAFRTIGILLEFGFYFVYFTPKIRKNLDSENLSGIRISRIGIDR